MPVHKVQVLKLGWRQQLVRKPVIGIYARVGGSSSKTNVEGVNYTNSHLNT